MKARRSRVAGLAVLTTLVLLMLGGCHSGQDPTPEGSGGPIALCVMTYNILFAFPNPEYDPWSVRKEHVAAVIRSHDPDLIGLQEPFPHQVWDLYELCPGYDGALLDYFPDSTILYKADRFVKLEEGHYWLSPTPDVPFSIGFGNFFPRMVIWVRLREKTTGREVLFVNTHFDNTSPSQEMSAPLFLERTEELAGRLPVVITGDFNSRPEREAYLILVEGLPGPDGGEPFRLVDTYDLALRHEALARDDDPRVFDPAGRIDHIFVANRIVACDLWTVDMYTYDVPGKDPSDHFAVVAHIEVN